MAVMPSMQHFRLVLVKFLLTFKKVTTIKMFLRSLVSTLLADFKASKLSQLGQFLFYCPFKGGYFSPATFKWVSAPSAYERCPLTTGFIM